MQRTAGNGPSPVLGRASRAAGAGRPGSCTTCPDCGLGRLTAAARGPTLARQRADAANQPVAEANRVHQGLWGWWSLGFRDDVIVLGAGTVSHFYAEGVVDHSPGMPGTGLPWADRIRRVQRQQHGGAWGGGRGHEMVRGRRRNTLRKEGRRCCPLNGGPPRVAPFRGNPGL